MARATHAPPVRKRKAADIADEIVVARQSSRARQSTLNFDGTLRAPLALVNASNVHNKRRRVLDCVLIPVPRKNQEFKKDFAAVKSVRVDSMQDELELHDELDVQDEPDNQDKLRRRNEPSRQNELNESLTGAPPKANGRPRRSVTRTSFVPDVSLWGDNSEDELGPTRKNVDDSSDYHEDEDMSDAKASEEEDEDEIKYDTSSIEGREEFSDVVEEGISDVEEETAKKKIKKPEKAKSSVSKGESAGTKASREDMRPIVVSGNKGLASSLPPLHEITEIFHDITNKALELGLTKAVDHLKCRPLRIVTMCSGTESPLLALEMVSDALAQLGLDTIDVEHVFSAEIVPFKQAYIERNFAPPAIFRDITEFVEAFEVETEDKRPKATTAYGSIVDIPTNVDIVIAGTSCVDYSALNNQKKKIDEGGESGKTWEGCLAYCKACRPAIIVFENIEGAAWGRMLQHYRDLGYDCRAVLASTKDFYIPHVRHRGYMVCFDQRRNGLASEATTQSGLATGTAKQWQDLMEKFRRPASCPVSSYLMPNDRIVVRNQAHDDDAVIERDWSQCEITQMNYRSEAKLGTARPFTQWQESGTMVVPENGSASWYRRRTEREKDTIDCSILRKAVNGMYDTRYKTRIWNLSQNVYRDQDHQPFGITGCLTPGGMFFISDAGRVMAPEESLMLQGLPLDKVSFTTETSNDLQDLAGNAMTSTVVGSALLSALILGHKLVNPSETLRSCPTVKAKQSLPRITSSSTERRTYLSNESGACLATILDTAKKSSRRCYCEGSYGICKKPIQECIDCGHTTCVSCGGSPAHNYRPMLLKDRLLPSTFEQSLRPQLPLNVAFEIKGTISTLLDGVVDCPRGYTSAVKSAFAAVFSFQEVRRTHCWTVSYVADATARLDLVIEGSYLHWRLFALPEKNLASDSELRSVLQRQPVAKAVITDSIFDVTWQLHVPGEKEAAGTKLRLSSTRSATWWARSALPTYDNHTQPERIDVETHTSVTAEEKTIAGSYHLLPRCGTACDSLYSKDVGDAERPVFLFLDPSRIGSPDDDCFVFSYSKAVLGYDDVREIIAYIKAPWRPWQSQTQPKRKTKAEKSDDAVTWEKLLPAKIALDGTWRHAPTLALQPCDTTVEIRRLLANMAPRVSKSTCHQAQLMVSCSARTPDGVVQARNNLNQASDSHFLSKNAWMFEAMRRQLTVNEWQPIDENFPSCGHCAPARPQVSWKLADDRKSVKPCEDPETAAKYERSMKTRPDALVVTSISEAGRTVIEFGVNVTSMAQRAIARLPTSTSQPHVSWRLDTSGTRNASTSIPGFKLKATKGVEPYVGELKMPIELFPQQRLSLTWMRSQEAGAGTSFEVEEAEEAVLPVQGWRAEVRARVPFFVRGGICADHPGFGKTITSIALVQAQLLDTTPAQLKADLRSRLASRSQSGLIPSTATVIVCPGTILKQWNDEIVDKIGLGKGLLTINKADHLSGYTIEQFADAKIILVNRTIFSNEAYYERLAAFAGLPGPAAISGRWSGRSLAHWLRFAKGQISESLDVYRESGSSGLKAYLRSKYEDILQSDDFKASVPSRRLRGKAYVENSGKKKAVSSKGATPKLDVSNADRPVFEMFYFNRLIVDEFHDCSLSEFAAVVALEADKRWGLSATPALDDLYDLHRLGALLGVPLRIGSDARGIMKVSNIKQLRTDMTEFERFDAMRQTPSNVMHLRIHEIDQAFLDTFVRQNVMDFTQMEVHQSLLPVWLDLAHRATYMELSQHMNSSEMRVKKRSKARGTHRDEKLHTALKDSETKEEALSRTAAFSERIGSDIDETNRLVAAIRYREAESEELRSALGEAMDLAKGSEPTSFAKWIDSRIDMNTIGDGEVLEEIKRLLRSTTGKRLSKSSKAKRKKSSSDDESDNEDEDEGGDKTAKKSKNLLTSKVNDLCNRLIVSTRSVRYLQKVRAISRSTKDHQHFHLDCACKSSSDPAVSAVCGHVVCSACWSNMDAQQTYRCPSPDCASAMHSYQLLWKHQMGTDVPQAPYGAKLETSLDLLTKIHRAGDQAILFVDHPSQLHEVQLALEDHPALHKTEVLLPGRTATSQITAFQTNSDIPCLVLNASDESAAGLNLQNANHVVFLSPLLRESQYLYDATMAQAIGRVRRHGQKKPVYVHRVVALDTIDVDVLEHREKRADAIGERGMPALRPPKSIQRRNALVAGDDDGDEGPRKERMQLVRENGKFSLRPRSWLENGEEGEMRARKEGRVEGWEKFTSLIRFSAVFTEDDE
ncbi:hypothetical protein B0A50_07445 [Salinomyces thailandicus]|uniref:Helicase C-terminal domain-containing protein n=1 Tax=Salinomyces thailandicus TaxID=706561 RepID=A0A4U0TNL4_9PEZI|nr:hypothetical protein B0A50_07445 [Salinomyces thailandica]